MEQTALVIITSTLLITLGSSYQESLAQHHRHEIAERTLFKASQENHKQFLFRALLDTFWEMCKESHMDDRSHAQMLSVQSCAHLLRNKHHYVQWDLSLESTCRIAQPIVVDIFMLKCSVCCIFSISSLYDLHPKTKWYNLSDLRYLAG